MQQGARSAFFFSWFEDLWGPRSNKVHCYVTMKGWMFVQPFMKKVEGLFLFGLNTTTPEAVVDLGIQVMEKPDDQLQIYNWGGLVTHWPGHPRCTMHMTSWQPSKILEKPNDNRGEAGDPACSTFLFVPMTWQRPIDLTTIQGFGETRWTMTLGGG